MDYSPVRTALVVTTFRTHSYILQATNSYVESVLLRELCDIVKELTYQNSVILAS